MELPAGWDPCCGVSLKKGAKLIGMIDMIVSVATACFSGFAILITFLYGSEIKAALDRDRAQFPESADMYDDLGNGLVIGVLLLIFISSMLYYMLAQMLLNGAKQKNIEKLHTWFRITAILLTLRISFYLVGLFAAANPTVPFFGILGVSYTAYSLWVVHCFMKELTNEESFGLRPTQGGFNNPVYKL